MVKRGVHRVQSGRLQADQSGLKGKVVAQRLFDHHKASTKTTNPADDKSYLPIVERLHKQLDLHIQSTEAWSIADRVKTGFRESGNARKQNKRGGYFKIFFLEKSSATNWPLYPVSVFSFLKNCMVGHQADGVNFDESF
jgi:hypothetical protein